ncbi:ArnT family glycosyltransferase [Legionella fairfieldensis]|uniref:ArnT family glycosyltransferase n=1 Tax=Legionella fairfieldensis TaxID=45064 RepID=UPI00048C821E|nr:glycosyltransferase family 39 protein [Legionella fairfieldensis]
MIKLNHYLLLGFFSLLLFMPGINQIPAIDRDEAHFAQATRQMLQTGQYFQIRFQEKTRFQKPPGINWLQAVFVKLFSQADASVIWPYRIPSLSGALLSILLTYFFSRRFVKARIALLASAFLAASLLLVFEAHMAVIDASLLASVVLMQGALWIIYQRENNKPISWGWALCFWLAMAYGFVLKGVTPLVGGLSIVSLCLVERQIAWLRRLHVFSGLIVLTLLSLAWLHKVNAAEQSNYLLQMIHKDLLPKLQGGHESHGKPPLFHLLLLPLTFWPASLFLWQAGVYAFYHRHEKAVKFLLCWILPTWLFFEIMPTKLPQYVLPTFPAIALLSALAVHQDNQTKSGEKGLHFLQILWAILSVSLALALASVPYFVMQQVSSAGITLFIVVAVLSCLAVYFSWHNAYKRASLVILLMALITYPLVFRGLLPYLQPVWLSSTIAQLVDKNNFSKEKPLLVAGYEEPSVVFNFNTNIVQFIDASVAEKILQADPSRKAIIESAIFDHWVSDHLALSVLARVKGYNYSKGRWVELFLVGKDNTGEN